MTNPDEDQGAEEPTGAPAQPTVTAATIDEPTARRRKRRPTLAPGECIGRYRVIGAVGEGGMGIVYKAHDPELDRIVALKVLRVSGNAEGTAGNRARLLREARALAQLSHPNVIAVHDVGAIGDEVFIAMEFVDGLTLRAWLGVHPRSVREILEAFVAAGRGLRAAHRAGLIHRDFKPENVIVDGDGRVRVLDFGLARGAQPDDDGRPEAGADSRVALDCVTLEGHVAGTPPYMALEQHLGQEVDARSDQFAFCIALYEALYARRPFAGSSSRELRAAVERGLTEPPAYRRGLSRRVRNAIARGLSPTVADRFPTMEALLEELQPRTYRRTALVVAVLGASAAGALAAGMLTTGRTSEMCAVPPTAFASAWSATTRGAMDARFQATGRLHASHTFASVAALLDQREVSWRRMRQEACEATRVRGEQSEAMLDLRMECLDRRLAEARALTDLFTADPDGELVDRALQAVLALPSIERCADGEALRAAYPRPDDPDRRAEIERLQVRLDEVAALQGAGRYEQALEPARGVVAGADEVGWAPLQASATFQLGLLQSHNGELADAEATLARAMTRAAEARDDELFIRAGLERVYVLGYELARPDDALELAKVLEPFLKRVDDNGWSEAKFFDTRGIVLWSRGAYQEAQLDLERALPLYRQSVGPDHPNVAACHTNLGNALADQGRSAEARVHYEQELSIVLRTLGEDHPDAARARANLGTVQKDLGEAAAAQQNFERALEIWERAYGPKNMMVAMASNNLGDLQHALGEHAAALTACQRALEIGEEILPPGHPIHGHHLRCTAHALIGLERHGEAAVHLRRAVAIREQSGGDPGSLADLRFALARAMWEASEDRPGALQLARVARDAYLEAGERRANELGLVDEWLATRGPGLARRR